MTATTNQAASLCNMSAPFSRPDLQNNLFPQTFVLLWFQQWDREEFHSKRLWLPALWSHKKKKKRERKILETITSICKFQFWFAKSSKNHYRTWQCQSCLLYLKYFAAHSRTSTFYLLCIAFRLVPSMQSSDITRSILQAVPLGYTLILPCPSGLLDIYLSCEI